MADTQDDFPASTATTGYLPLGQVVVGRIETAGDVDWFRFHADAGQHYLPVPFQLQDAAPTVFLHLQLYDSAGKLLPYIPNTGLPFEPLISGDYYLAAQSSFLGPYGVRLLPVDDDYSANLSGAGQLSPGVALSGGFQYSGDVDSFTFHAQAGQVYRFDMSGSGVAFVNMQSSMRDPGGNPVQLDVRDVSNGERAGWFSPAVSGDYAISLSTGYMLDQGDYYTIKETLAGTDDYASTIAQATALEIGTPLQGAVEFHGDNDVFKVRLAAGTTYCFSLLADSDTGAPDMGLALSRSDGSNIASLAFGLAKAYFYTPRQAETVYLSASTSYDFTTPYTLSVSLASDDHGGNAAGAGALQVAGSVDGLLEVADDRDWFAITLDAGATYWFALHGTDGAQLDSSNAKLNLRDAQGKLIDTTLLPGYAIAPVLPFVPKQAGTYYLEVENLGHGGAYQLQASYGTVDDVGNDAAHATALRVGVPKTGTTELATDVDVFRISVVAGQSYVIDLAGSAEPTWNTVSYVFVDDINGKGLPFADFVPIDTYAHMITPDKTGDLFIHVNYSIGSEGGNYGLVVTPARVLDSTAGNDFMSGPGNGMHLDGGAGIDTVCYSRGASDYSIVSAAGHTTVTGHGWTSGDTLDNVERLLFTDRAIALDISGHGGQAYRLYQAAFNRTPDQAGVGYWISAMDHGASLQSVAHEFVASAEFISAYGSKPSDADFVNLLYHNVLHRDGDAGGIAYWQNALHDGALREQVLASFSESAENQAALIGQIGNGFSYIPYS